MSSDAIAAALADGMDQGVAETLQILYELEELDEESWRLICGILEEIQRKVDRSAAAPEF